MRKAHNTAYVWFYYLFNLSSLKSKQHFMSCKLSELSSNLSEGEFDDLHDFFIKGVTYAILIF